MEIPFLFLNEDIFYMNNAFSNENGLKRAIEDYHPSFIITPIERKNFKYLISKHPEYKVVFFDETSILYVNRKDLPVIADKYELKELDPYTIMTIDIGKIMHENKYEAVLKELSMMFEIYDGCGLTNQLFAVLHKKRGEFDKMIKYADNIIKYYPEAFVGYNLKADALQGMKKYNDSLIEYKKALKKAVNKAEIYQEIAGVYMKQKKYKEAYKTYRIITDPFSERDYKYMHDVCFSAAMSGNKRDAEILFSYAHALVPTEDKEWNEKYVELKKMIK